MQHNLPIKIPLGILALLSIVGGFVAIPSFLASALPELVADSSSGGTEIASATIAALVALAGIAAAYVLFYLRPNLTAQWSQSPIASTIHRYWFAGWGFDWLYDLVFVRPVTWFANAGRNDWFDLIYQGIARITVSAHVTLAGLQNGRTRMYAMGIAAGAILTIAIAVFLWH